MTTKPAVIKGPVVYYEHEWNIMDADGEPLALVQQVVNDSAHQIKRIARANQIITALNSHQERQEMIKGLELLLSFAPADDYLSGAGRDDGKPRRLSFFCDLTDKQIAQLREMLARVKG